MNSYLDELLDDLCPPADVALRDDLRDYPHHLGVDQLPEAGQVGGAEAGLQLEQLVDVLGWL